MTSKLKCPVCPYCDKPLHCDGTQYINELIVEMWYCQNAECEETEDLIGTREMWEIVAKMIQAKQDLAKAIDVIDTVRQHKRGTAVICPNDIAAYCDKALEQIDHIADVSKMVEHKEI